MSFLWYRCDFIMVTVREFNKSVGDESEGARWRYYSL